MKKALGVIPARLGSSRFPGKPLAEFLGKTMIEHTYAAAAASSLLDKVVVATDSERIRGVIERIGGDTMLTGDCATGTDRIVQALHRMGPAELSKYDIVVNIQGDEPGVNPTHIDLCVEALRNADAASVMSTLATPVLNEHDATSRDVVKCVADHQGAKKNYPILLLVDQERALLLARDDPALERRQVLAHDHVLTARGHVRVPHGIPAQVPVTAPLAAGGQRGPGAAARALVWLQDQIGASGLNAAGSRHEGRPGRAQGALAERAVTNTILEQVVVYCPATSKQHTHRRDQRGRTMFAKPQKTSGSSLVKNKDVKKLRKDVGARLHIDDDAKLQELFPSKSDVRKVSFQAPSRMVFYSVEDTREPVLFDVSGKGDFCFTVYALWRVVDLLPKLFVHAPVSEFVLRGADVMLPGVVFASMDEVASLRKGELRAVYARGNPAPFAVGEMLVDGVDIERHGKKGKALRLLHSVGDELWQMGPKTVPNEGFLGHRVVPIDAVGEVLAEDSDGDDEGANASAKLSLDDVALEEKLSHAAGQQENQDAAAATADDDEAAPEITKEEMDQLYVSTLLQVLKSSKIKEKELPMLASTFQASVFLPNRAAGVSLNVKQSSFKKTSLFLKQMETRGLLKVAEKDGIQTITAISRRHPDVITHELYRTEEEAKRDQEAAANAAAGLPAFVPGQYAPEIEEFLGLPQSVKAIFLSEREHAATHFQEVSDKKHWRASEVRDLITKYIEVKDLVDVRDKKFIKLDGPLTDALFGKKAPAGGYPQQMARPDVLAQLLSKCQKFHRIKLFPGHEAKISGGDIRQIAIHAERSKAHANSITTSIAFYQQFGIDGTSFAKEAQKKWGCSATTQASPDKNKVEEIKVQGQMVNEILDYLATKYRINTSKFCAVSYGKNVKAKKK